MDIVKKLPFNRCENCPEFVMKVEEQFIHSTDGYYNKVMIVKCKNERLCRYLKRKHDEQ